MNRFIKFLALLILVILLFLFWKIFGFNDFNWENLLKWSRNPIMFFLFWGVQAIFYGKWLASEMRSALSVGKSVLLAWACLIAVLLLFLNGFQPIAMLLVVIGILPLLTLGLIWWIWK